MPSPPHAGHSLITTRSPLPSRLPGCPQHWVYLSLHVASRACPTECDVPWEREEAQSRLSPPFLLSLRPPPCHPWKVHCPEDRGSGETPPVRLRARGTSPSVGLMTAPLCGGLNGVSSTRLNLISCGSQIIFYFQLRCCSHYRSAGYKCRVTGERRRGGREDPFCLKDGVLEVPPCTAAPGLRRRQSLAQLSVCQMII